MRFNKLMAGILSVFVLFPFFLVAQGGKMNSNYWTATDGLGRQTIGFNDAGQLNPGKYAGIFYWTWHTDSQSDFPFLMNTSEILKQYPEAADSLNHPAWKNMLNGGLFWWDEPLLGYYRLTDEWVLRKHAQMLANAGIDFVVFDCTNKTFTFKSAYTSLLKVWKQAKEDGVNTPRVAFMLNFNANSASLASITQLYNDLYGPGSYKDQWFMWDGKPLIIAYPEMLEPHTNRAGLKFLAEDPFNGFAISCADKNNSIKNFTVKLFSWVKDYNTTISAKPVYETTFNNFTLDTIRISFNTTQEGHYYLEINDVSESVELKKIKKTITPVVTYYNGNIVPDGNLEGKLFYSDGDSEVLTENKSNESMTLSVLPGIDSVHASLVDSIKNFFTFRPGQPDYVNGPSRNDQWGWLEVYPQNGYVKKPGGGYEQVPVGVAQNASDESKGHCSSFNQPLTYGRSYTKEDGQNSDPDAFYYGYNFQEQWNRAFELNPDVVFITGWNEWTAGRYDTISWPNKYAPFSFVDEYNWEKSRDIEPVKSWGNKGDTYYMQMVNNVRKFKGMDVQEPASEYKSISIGNPESWKDVKPEYRDFKGDVLWRDSRGLGEIKYSNKTGRNDIVLSKVARDDDYIYFYAETMDSLSSETDTCWMNLWINIDMNFSTGWEGYDFVINRNSPGDFALVEKSVNNNWNWVKAGDAEIKISGNILEIKVARSVLDMDDEDLNFEFKWSDNTGNDGNIMDFYTNGDAAPDGRFNYVFSEED